MRDKDDLPEFRYDFLPFAFPNPNIDRDIMHEINLQMIEFLTEAMKHKDYPFRAVRIFARAERVLNAYTSIDDMPSLLQPMQAELQRMLRVAFRMARRAFIRACLRDGLDPYRVASEAGRELHDADAEDDFAAVEAHLRQGARLNEGLWRSRAEREGLGLQ